MEVRLKLMGILRAKTPDGGKLELPETATVEDVFQTLDIDPTHVNLVTVNSEHVRDHSRALSDGDEVMLLPPVGGG